METVHVLVVLNFVNNHFKVHKKYLWLNRENSGNLKVRFDWALWPIFP